MPGVHRGSTYLVDQRICDYIVIRSQCLQRETTLFLPARRRHAEQTMGSGPVAVGSAIRRVSRVSQEGESRQRLKGVAGVTYAVNPERE